MLTLLGELGVARTPRIIEDFSAHPPEVTLQRSGESLPYMVMKPLGRHLSQYDPPLLILQASVV